MTEPGLKSKPSTFRALSQLVPFYSNHFASLWSFPIGDTKHWLFSYWASRQGLKWLEPSSWLQTTSSIYSGFLLLGYHYIVLLSPCITMQDSLGSLALICNIVSTDNSICFYIVHAVWLAQNKIWPQV